MPGFQLEGAYLIFSIYSEDRKVEGWIGRTNVDSEVSYGRKKDLDIWTGNEFGVHSSSVFEEGATQQSLGSEKAGVNGHTIASRWENYNHLHSKPFGNARKIPHRFYCGFRGLNLHSGACGTRGAVGVKQRPA